MLVSSDHFPKFGVLHGLSTDERQIMCRRIVERVVEAVRVVEMSVRTTDLLRSLIHQLREGLDRTGDVHGNRVATIVGASQH